jgi:glycosyltransferase involved in cell wall biosynthesis
MDRRKKIFINASTVLFSGGLILSQSIIETLIAEDCFEITITCPRYGPYKDFETKHSLIKVVPPWMLHRLLRWVHDCFWLPVICRRENPDLVLTLGNLPARTHYKQIFLHDNPFLIEKNLSYIPLSITSLFIHKFRCILTLQRMSFVNLILVQTEYQKQGLNLIINGDKPIKVLTPHIPIIRNPNQTYKFPIFPLNNKIKILCLSRYYEHKNIEKLFEVAQIIKAMGLPFIIYLTISKNHGKKARQLIKSINTGNFNDILINIGHSHHNNVPGIVNQVDAIILPSLLESFSLSCIEAWKYRKPLFTSNLDSLKSSCGKAAFYFNPFSASDILKCLTDAYKNPDQISTIINEGDKRLNELSKWSEYSALIKDF